MLKQRIDKFKQNILKTLKNFGFIINMLWKNSPWQCVFIIIIETLSSFIPLAYVYISKKIIDSILLEYTNKAIGTLILWCVLLVIINISGKVLANIRTIISTQSGAKMNKRINELIIQKCLEFDVSFYDDKESYTAIKEAYQTLGRGWENMIGSVFSIFGQLMTVVSLASTLLIANAGLGLLLLISLIPFLIFEVKSRKARHNFQKNQIPENKKTGYLSGILTGRGYAKEVRLFGYGSALKEEFSRIFDKKIDDQSRLLKRDYSIRAVLSTVVMIMDEKRVWGIHTQDDSLFLQHSVIAIGWKQMGDLSLINNSREAFKESYINTYPASKKGAVANGAGMLYRFIHEVQIGDYVVFPSKTNREINIGVIEGDYQYVPDAVEYSQQRKVKWLKHLPRTAFSQGALYEVGSAMSFFSLKNYADEYLAALDKNFQKSAIEQEDDTVAATAEDIIETTRDFILKELSKNLKGYDLEEFVADLLCAMGYRTSLSPHGGDSGIDITAYARTSWATF